MGDNGAAMVAARRRTPAPVDPLACLCGDIAAVFRRVWGRGPRNTTAHWAGANMLVVVLHDGHTEAERTMRALGQLQQVMDGRRLLHEAVTDQLTSIVARTLGRRVETVLMATRLDPDLSAAIFFLEPASRRRAEHLRPT